MMYRRRHEQKMYDRAPKSEGCPFCSLDDTVLNPQPRKTIKEFVHFSVIENMFPYYIWEYMDVLEHWLIVPKRHVTTMRDLSSAERKELVDIFCEYEDKGYSVYTRAPKSAARTLPHIHTHLIKIVDKEPRAVLGIKKPYFVIKF